MRFIQELDELKEKAQVKSTVLTQERKFYETQCENNDELRQLLSELYSQATSQRQRNQELINITTHLNSEVVAFTLLFM